MEDTVKSQKKNEQKMKTASKQENSAGGNTSMIGDLYSNARQYIIPFLLYMGITPLLGVFIEDPTYAGYVIKTIILLGVLIYFRKKFSEIKFHNHLLAIAAGIAIIVMWIAIDGWYPHIGEPSQFNPFLFDSGYAYLIIVFKLLGMIIIAPVIEELFTRSFLMRYIISDRFKEVPIGQYSLLSFVITVAFFGLAHNRWLAGIITGVILNLLLYKTKSIGDCITAHAVANAILAGYVLYAQDWFMW